MDTILDILSMLFDFTLFGSILLFVIKFFHHQKNMGAKKQIDHLQAKMAMLRMSLKAKVKKKVNLFKTRYVDPANTGDTVDSTLNLMLENKFETSADFQNYFDYSKKVNDIIKVDIEAQKQNKDTAPKSSLPYKPSTEPNPNSITPPENIQKFEDFMGTDFKNELSIIGLIKEMVETTQQLNERIIFYNRLNKKSKYKTTEELIFNSLSDVNRVFRENSPQSEDERSHELPTHKQAS